MIEDQGSVSVQPTLGDFLNFRNGKTSPPRSADAAAEVFGANGVIGKTEKANFKGPTVIIGRVGSYCGSLHYSPDPIWVTDNAIACIPKRPADASYWYYALQTLGLNARSSGSGQPLLNQTVLGQIPFSPQEAADRDSIAEVLGSLDDKIAANQKIVGTSAQLALALLAEATESEAVRRPIADVTTLLARGITPSYAEGEEGSMVVLNQKCVRGQRVLLSASRRTGLNKVRAEKILKGGDVLVNSTGQGTLGRVARWTGTGDVTVDSHITIVRFDSNEVDPTCAGYAMLGLQPTIEELGEGSTGQTELSRVELGRLNLVLPSRETSRSIGARLTTMAEIEDSLLRENDSLAELRDTLLPELMSGRLRAKDAEKQIEEVL